MEMKSRSLLKSGSGLRPPRRNRSPSRIIRTTALPGLSFGLGTASVVNIGLGSPFTTFRAYRSLLSTASVRRGGIPTRWEGPVSCYLPKQVRDCGAWNMNMKSRSLLKSGSGLRPPRRSRATAPGPTCSASGSLIRARQSLPLVGLTGPFSQPRPSTAAESLHDGKDP